MGRGLFWVRFIPQLNRGNMDSGGGEHVSWFFQTDKKAEIILQIFILLFADSQHRTDEFPSLLHQAAVRKGKILFYN